MKLNLLDVGTKIPPWAIDSSQEYAKHLSRDHSLHLHEIATGKRGKSGSATQCMREAKQYETRQFLVLDPQDITDRFNDDNYTNLAELEWLSEKPILFQSETQYNREQFTVVLR